METSWQAEQPKYLKLAKSFIRKNYKGKKVEILRCQRSESGWWQLSIQVEGLPNPSGFMWSLKNETWSQTY